MKGKDPLSLTPMQRRFMLALQARLEASPDVAPTYEELRRDLGLASKAGVSRLVMGCEQRGRIVRRPGRDRSIRVVHPVTLEEAHGEGDFLKAFSDRELLQEAARRGLFTVTPVSAHL